MKEICPWQISWSLDMPNQTFSNHIGSKSGWFQDQTTCMYNVKPICLPLCTSINKIIAIGDELACIKCGQEQGIFRGKEEHT